MSFIFLASICLIIRCHAEHGQWGALSFFSVSVELQQYAYAFEMNISLIRKVFIWSTLALVESLPRWHTLCRDIALLGRIYYNNLLFCRDKKRLSCTLCRATGRTLLYHMGSAALGAFLITLLRIPRYILMKMHQK